MVLRATKITAHTTKNLAYQTELNIIAEKITKGEQFSTYMESRPRLFPPILSQMVSVGENTGNLSETFLYLADMYEDEVDELTKNISTILEPMLLVFMGLIVGFVAISIITPIYELTQHLRP